MLTLSCTGSRLTEVCIKNGSEAGGCHNTFGQVTQFVGGLQ